MALVLAKETGTSAFTDVSASSTVSFASLPGAGSLIVVMVAGTVDNGTEYTVNTVSDNQGNTYTRRVSCPDAGDGNVEIWTAENIGTPSGTFTITVDHAVASANYGIVEAYEVTGAVLSDATEQTTTGGGASPTDGDFIVTLTQAKQIIFAGIVITPSGLVTQPTNYTELTENSWGESVSGNDYKGEFCFRIVSTAGQHTEQFSHPDADWVLAVATFKEVLPTSSVRAGGAVTGSVRKNALATSSVRAAAAVNSTKTRTAANTSSCAASGVLSSAVLKGATSTSATRAAGAATSTSTKAVSSSSAVGAAGAVTTVGIQSRPSVVTAAGAITSTGRKSAIASSSARAAAIVTTVGLRSRSSTVGAAAAVTSTKQKATSRASTVTASSAVTGATRKNGQAASIATSGAAVMSAHQGAHANASVVGAAARSVVEAFRPFAPAIRVKAVELAGPNVRAQVLGRTKRSQGT